MTERAQRPGRIPQRQPVPRGHRRRSPCGLLREVLGGVERGEREVSADGTIGHAEVEIGDSVVMLSEATTAYPSRPSVCFAYVEDVDSVVRKAVAAGAELILEPTDQAVG